MRRLLLVLMLLVGFASPSYVIAGSGASRIDSISPARARHGDVVTIKGSGFGGKSVRITVGGVPASLLSATGSQVSFRVPDAAPSGQVVVRATNPGGHYSEIGLEIISDAFDGNVTPVVDGASSVSVVVGKAGGTLSASGLTLTIPADALIEPTEIVLTPMTGLQGSPFSRFVAGAVFEPAGLRFLTPATLTVTLPPSVTVQEAVSFGMNVDAGAGSNFHLIPYRAEGSSLSVSIRHFSGAGVVAADPTELAEALGYEPSPADELADQRIAAIGEQWEAEQITSAQRDAAIENALRDWYRSVRSGWQSATGASMEFFELAAADWYAWRARIREYSTDEAFSAELTESRALALAAAVNLTERLLSRCTGSGDPFEPLPDIARFAVLTALDPATFDLASQNPDWANGAGLIYVCVSVVVDAFDAPQVLASSHENTFEADARLRFYNGPDRRDIGLIYELYRLEPLENVLEGTITSTNGHFSLPVQVSDEKPFQSYNLFVTLEQARSAGDDVLNSFTQEESLTRPVRERIELAGRRPNDTDYQDVLTNVRAGATVSVRVQVAGDGMETAVVSFAAEGGGTLSADSRAVGPGGEAFITYTAPQEVGAHVCVVASIPELDGAVSEDRLCFDIISADLVYTGSVLSTINQPSFEECFGEICRTRNGNLRESYSVRLQLQSNGSFAASGTFTYQLFDQFITTYQDTGETCQSTRRASGSGEVISYGGTLANPAGILTARYTYSDTFENGPCRGQPASTSTSTGTTTSSVGNAFVTPVYEGGVLVALVWNFSEFDAATNTSYAISGQVRLIQ